MSSYINGFHNNETDSNEFIKMRDFIKYRTGPIPEEFKFDGWCYGKACVELMHVWIEYRPGEDIPDDMEINGR